MLTAGRRKMHAHQYSWKQNISSRSWLHPSSRVDVRGRGLTEEVESTKGVMYFLNENQNGSLNEELSNKGELKKYQGRVFRDPDICSQEQEEGILTEYITFKAKFRF